VHAPQGTPRPSSGHWGVASRYKAQLPLSPARRPLPAAQPRYRRRPGRQPRRAAALAGCAPSQPGHHLSLPLPKLANRPSPLHRAPSPAYTGSRGRPSLAAGGLFAGATTARSNASNRPLVALRSFPHPSPAKNAGDLAGIAKPAPAGRPEGHIANNEFFSGA
jgi:hypothetical protein